MALARPCGDDGVQAGERGGVEAVKDPEEIKVGMFLVEFAAGGGTVEHERAQIVACGELEFVNQIG